MSFFGGKKQESSQALLGVDLGTTGLKVVELAPEGGKVRLVTYGYADIPVDQDASATLSLDNPKKIADVLRAIMKESGMKATKAVASLPASSVFHAIINIPTPKSDKEDIRPAVEAQTAKLLPLPIAEMIIDSHVIDETSATKEGETQAQSRTVRVQVTAAPKALVEKYIAVFRLAKIELISLETEVFALMRSLVGKDTARVMIVDIGGERTNIVVAERGVPYLTRGTKMGGGAVTQALASTMSLGLPEAESTKKDLSQRSGATMPPVILTAMKPLLHEVNYSLQMSAEEGNSHTQPINKVILTGGSAGLVGLDTAMTSALNVNVYIGDPWARIATPPQSRAVLDDIGSRFSVAIGLAMRVVNEKDR